MEFISIGPYCRTTEILHHHKLRLNAYPFDYIFSSLEIVAHAILDNFNIFLDKQYFTSGTNKTSMRHSYYCKMLDTKLLLHHHIKANYDSDYKVSSGNFFNHHNLFIDEDYKKFTRRCDRLLDLIKTNKKIVFVYYNCYTLDFADLIDFYNKFSTNKNIYIIGIYENNYESKILYENSNCKIYQNYDQSLIFLEMTAERPAAPRLM